MHYKLKEKLIDEVARRMNPEKYSWSAENKAELRIAASELIAVIGAFVQAAELQESVTLNMPLVAKNAATIDVGVKRDTPRTAPCAVSCRGDGDQVLALIGNDVQSGIAGFGDSLPDALRDLATELEHEVGYDSCGHNPQYRSYLRIVRVENIWSMLQSDGNIGLRLDSGDGGVIILSKDQAKQIINSLKPYTSEDSSSVSENIGCS